MSIAVITAVAVVSNHDLIYDAISHSVSTAGMGGLNMSNSFDQQIDQVMLKGNQISSCLLFNSLHTTEKQDSKHILPALVRLESVIGWSLAAASTPVHWSAAILLSWGT